MMLKMQHCPTPQPSFTRESVHTLPINTNGHSSQGITLSPQNVPTRHLVSSSILRPGAKNRVPITGREKIASNHENVRQNGNRFRGVKISIVGKNKHSSTDHVTKEIKEDTEQLIHNIGTFKVTTN
jgi:hypothetical protein